MGCLKLTERDFLKLHNCSKKTAYSRFFRKGLSLWGEDLSGSLQGAGGVGGLLAVTDQNTSKSYLPCYDGNGNVMAYIDSVDGSSKAEFEYKPDGGFVIQNDPLNLAEIASFSTKPYDENLDALMYEMRILKDGRWISRDPIGEKGGVNVYGFVGNDGINGWDYLGMWKYEFVTTNSGKAKYGDIIAIAEKNGESLKKLTKHWAFGSSKNWKEIRKGEYRTDKKVRTSTKVKKNCQYNLFNIMPQWYQKKVSRNETGNCHYSAIAYVDSKWLNTLERKYVMHGSQSINSEVMENIFLPRKMNYVGRFNSQSNGKPGDIINHYTRMKELGHSDIFLEKNKNGILYVFQKVVGHSGYVVVPYKNVYSVHKLFRKK